VFNGVLNPDNEEINYYYPTNDLVTGPDILFFWVARMVISGYEYRKEKPFSNVYLTGLVRDKQRRKMSKQLGNSPDALKLIEEFGADGVRVGLLLSSAAGNDLMFDEALCQQGKGFANKIWNAFRLVKGWEVVTDLVQPTSSKIGINWYKARFQQVLAQIEDDFSKYRISDALMATYKLVWDDFCSELLEIVKPVYQQPIDSITYAAIIEIFETNLKLLHPFMPFLTEEIWQHIEERSPENALIVSKWPTLTTIDDKIINEFNHASEVIAGIRTIRKEKNIDGNILTTFDDVILKLGNLEAINYVDDKVDGALSFRVKSNEYFIPLSGGAINIEAEIQKLKEELDYIEGFLKSVRGKLSNERFVNNAPEKVVAIERKKELDALSKIEIIKESILNLEASA